MLEIKVVSNETIEEFLEFLKRIARWLNESERGMWNIDKLEKDMFLSSNDISDCYMGYADDKLVASVILTEDNVFMWPDLKQDETIFIGKLGVAREYSGKGYAREMIDFAYDEAKKRSKKYLRLDCYADREYLCKLYEDYGFTLVEKREMMPGLFAALYEMKL